MKTTLAPTKTTQLRSTSIRPAPSSPALPMTAPGNGRLAVSAPTGARKPIRVLLADDHPVVRKGLSSCLAQGQQVVIVGEATNGQDALRKAKELIPDLVLMDIDMPLLNGLTAADILRKENPMIKVLI